MRNVYVRRYDFKIIINTYKIKITMKVLKLKHMSYQICNQKKKMT